MVCVCVRARAFVGGLGVGCYVESPLIFLFLGAARTQTPKEKTRSTWWGRRPTSTM
jgi:hypothetical protein